MAARPGKTWSGADNLPLPGLRIRLPGRSRRSFAHLRASLCAGGRVRTRSTMSPLRDLATQLAFKVTEAPAVLSQAVRGHRRG
jgi:hypothetical protein